MTDLLASMAGVPTSVCESARQLSAAIEFDPFDPISMQSCDLETYSQIYEQLMYLKNNSTLNEEARREFFRTLQADVRRKMRSATQLPKPKDPSTCNLGEQTIIRPAAPRALPSSPVASGRDSSRQLQQEMLQLSPLEDSANALLALAGA